MSTTPYAKFIARITGWQSTDEDEAGEITLHLEWKKLDGDREGGKYIFHSDPLRDEEALRTALRVSLAAWLATKFTFTKPLRPKDVLILL